MKKKASIDNSPCAVILAGGTGTRFWPLSTARKPKQFLSVFGDRSLIQMSVDRLDGLIPPERILVMTSADYVDLTASQLPEIPPENIIGEPCRRDTAAAVGLAAYLCRARFGSQVIATLTADHLIEPTDRFQAVLASAIRAAEREPILYTLGIPPDRPATGYGYLERGPLILEDRGIRHYEVQTFREKPTLETARSYVSSGRYFWNAGIFVWHTDAFIAELEHHLPGHADAFAPLMAYDSTPGWQDALESAFTSLPPVSVDIGIMERAESVRCVEAGFSWRDVGSWHALTEHLPADNHGNYSQCRLLSEDANDNIVYCEDPNETVLTIGINNIVIVRAGDKTLIVPKDRVEDIKTLVSERLSNRNGNHDRLE